MAKKLSQSQQEYLDKKTNSFYWIKNVCEKDLLAEVFQALPAAGPGPFRTNPFKHQLECIVLGLYNDSFLYFLDMGLGKTLIGLFTLLLKPRTKKILIVVPNEVTMGSWADEIKKHTFLTYTILKGTKQKRIKLFEECDTDIYIINYAGLQVFLSDKEKGKKRCIPKEKIDYFCERFDSVIYDEIHYAQTAESLTFSLCKEISLRCKYRYGLTGTPINRNLMPLWSQFYLIDLGETFGSSFYFFKNTFFVAKKAFWGGIEYKFNKKLEPVLIEKVKNKSIRYEDYEGVDLPEKIYKSYPLVLGKEAAMYYNQVLDGCIKSIKSKQDIDCRKGVFVKLRQISSGFLNYKNEDEEEDVTNCIVFDENPKLEMLKEVITCINEDSKILIFHDYIKSGDLIEKLLKQMKIKCLRLYGKTKDKEDVRERFLNDKSVRILVANSKSGSVAINLQGVCYYTVYYESPVSSRVRKQGEKRTHRTGQINKCFYIDFITSKIEQRILEFIQEGKDISNTIISNENFIDELRND